MALTPLTLPWTNENINLQHSSAAGVPHGVAAAPCLADMYTPPFAHAAFSVQKARLLLPGQPLPKGVAAIAMALPASQL